ncbi:MAG: gliding motility-associated-like protein [Crocinitomicaceae bacterium]|jgi:gliding motility-associated-like protein
MHIQIVSILVVLLSLNLSGFDQGKYANVPFLNEYQEPSKCESLVVPKGFTPNDDGTNDLLQISILSDVTNFSFTVFNNWGEEVYRTVNPGFGWDGTSIDNSEVLPVGVYTYTCAYRCEDKEYELSGELTLLR